MYYFDITAERDLFGRNASYFVYDINQAIPNDAVYIEKDNRRVNAKSILGVLSLGVLKGDSLKVYTDGKYKDIINSILNDID